MPLWRSLAGLPGPINGKAILVSQKKLDTSLNMWDLYKLMPKDFRSIETVQLVKASQLNLLDAWDYEF